MVHYEPVYSFNLDTVIFKFLDRLPKILVNNVSNGKPWTLFLVWNFGPEIQKGSHPLICSSHIIPWFWRVDFPLVHTINLIRDVKDDVLLSVLDIPVFPIIAPFTTFHVHRCELIFPEHHQSGTTIINSLW